MEKRNSQMKTLSIVIEKDDTDEIAGSIDQPGLGMLTTVGNSEKEVIDNLKMLVADHIIHEGQDDPDWKDEDVANIDFTVEYNLTSFFVVYDELKIGSIAKLSGINPGLMRQYASGVKTASVNQVSKIQVAVHTLGERLTKISLVSA